LKFLPFVILLGSLLFPASADHLLLIRIVTQPDAAESFSIYNPTDSPIDLTNYYICDDEDYYKMQTASDLAPSNSIKGFTAQFPPISIDAYDTLVVILHANYTDYYGVSLLPDLVMYVDQNNSMIETEEGSFGAPVQGDGDPVPKLDDEEELLILFFWDGNPSSAIQDVDYFIWGNSQNAIDKSDLSGYQNDTPFENQFYFEGSAEKDYAYSRIGDEEIGEKETDGNGITGHDETSENFRESWEVKEIFKMGCTDSDASNFDPNAEIDDGNCALNFEDVINNCISEPITCEDKYDLSDPPQCPLYNNRVTIVGTIIDYYDITPNNGPYSFTLEDPLGYRISFVVWPESSSYQDGFDITQSAFSILTQSPFERFKVQISGKLDVYCRSGIELNIFNDWQVVVEYESDISIIEEIDMGGFFTEDNIKIVEIKPAPFVLIPTIGETLDYTYSHPGNSRIIIRIFDLSGRFITSLLDKYVIKPGTWSNGFNPTTGENSSASAWDGRDQLGQIVSPGTYIMHMEVMNPVTGETQTDAAPVVVGVKN